MPEFAVMDLGDGHDALLSSLDIRYTLWVLY